VQVTDMKRLLFRLVPSTPRTGEKESGSWLTPRASDFKGAASPETAMGAVERTGGPTNLPEQVQLTENGLWATPNCMDYLPQRSKEGTKHLQKGHRKGRSRPSNLREQVDEKTMKMWPTPSAVPRGPHTGREHHGLQTKSKTTGTSFGMTLETAVKIWPTPTRSDYKGSGPTNIRKDGKDRKKDRLDYAVEEWYPTPTVPGKHQVGTLGEWGGSGNKFRTPENMSVKTGALNPAWVEWLMGFPSGWTDLSS